MSSFFFLSQLSLSVLSLAKCASDSEVKPILSRINWNILTKRHCWLWITTKNHANWFFPDNASGKTKASRQEFRQAVPVPVTCIYIQHNHKATWGLFWTIKKPTCIFHEGNDTQHQQKFSWQRAATTLQTNRDQKGSFALTHHHFTAGSTLHYRLSLKR